jgi:hypothetical protein
MCEIWPFYHVMFVVLKAATYVPAISLRLRASFPGRPKV